MLRLLSHWLPIHVSEDVRNIVDGILVVVLGAVFAGLWRWAQGVRYCLGRLAHTILRYVTFRREILLWVDTEPATVRQLAIHLKKQLAASCDTGFRRTHVHVLKAPLQVLFHPRKPSVVAAVVLINTDVSKLSVDNKISERIQRHLLKYLEAGGGLVGGHDLIYRRARNEELRNAFGGRIDGFSSVRDSVPYVKIQPDHPIAKQLPDNFSLKDGEVLATKGWPANAEILFRLDVKEADKQHALVVARENADGRLVWLNSCDHQDQMCASIGDPEPHFVKLLSASVQWAARCG
jgi:hypothetical protein